MEPVLAHLTLSEIPYVSTLIVTSVCIGIGIGLSCLIGENSGINGRNAPEE
ncbi:MAG: hypothetical protein ABEJ65_12235 [bacterium]